MIILRKLIGNIERVYEDLKKVFDPNDPIIRSMASYLTKDKNICNEIVDIVLCNNANSAQNINSINPVSIAVDNATNNIYKDSTTGDPNFFETEKSITAPYTPYIDPNINNSISTSDIAIQSMNDKYNFKSYMDFVKWAIYEIEMNPPSPFNLGYPVSCYSLTLKPESFIIRFPNNIGIGIEVSVKGDSIFYTIDIVYFNTSFIDQILFKETDLYKTAIKNKWEIK